MDVYTCPGLWRADANLHIVHCCRSWYHSHHICHISSCKTLWNFGCGKKGSIVAEDDIHNYPQLTLLPSLYLALPSPFSILPFLLSHRIGHPELYASPLPTTPLFCGTSEPHPNLLPTTTSLFGTSESHANPLPPTPSFCGTSEPHASPLFSVHTTPSLCGISEPSVHHWAGCLGGVLVPRLSHSTWEENIHV